MHNAAREAGGDRSVERQATLAIDVANLDKAEQQMKKSVASAGGYISHEEGDQLAGETPVMTLTIRVPEQKFDDVVSGFEALGHRTQKSITASDLTEQILDLQAQVEQDTQKTHPGAAVNLDSSLPHRIQELEAERDALQQRAAMSTIYLTLQQKPSLAYASSAGADWSSDTWNAAMSAAMGALRVVGATGIWLLAFSPIWGPAAFVIFWLYRSHRRSIVRRRTQVA
ncbi:MAG TPA: DUF4349 domain-containing protein [Fimbriimonadaceae bacterium]|nr:DUF4349 domain-containing protein [Fimbriimonadaceae bacterium]